MHADEKFALKQAAKFAVPILALFLLSALYAVLYSIYGDVLFRNSWTKVVVAIFYPISMIIALSAPIGYLKRNYAYEVDMMFFFFCLSFAMSIVAVFAAVEFGAIDAAGEFSNELGYWFEKGLDFFLSVKHTFYISLAIISLTVAPQILSYVISGLFGCASSAIFVSEIMEVCFWLAIKPLITVAGILAGLTIGAYMLSIPKFTVNEIFTVAAVSSVLLYSSFSVVCVYKIIKNFMQGEESRIPQRWKDWIIAIHKSATQYNKAQPKRNRLNAFSKFFSREPKDYRNCGVYEYTCPPCCQLLRRQPRQSFRSTKWRWRRGAPCKFR
ncbi:hypothetical protein [Azospirillum argentinense]|uniref:Uncharacterized protein n=1 Tax=Azospirillum argentinense TaxID=2970906 RepID=A0A5B0KPT2_9PROT|nr:hypothetical protein [Azospirillum argentinense]KAA1053911.1 hypothetical protein FH063_002493 [Azospirillum argentinense]